MKGRRLYFIVIAMFVAAVFLFELSAPKEFVWKPTYDRNDNEPFGSYVFDDVLSSSIPDYKVIDKTFFQLYNEDSTAVSQAFLLTEDYFHFTKTDVNYLLKLLHNGNQVMICTDAIAAKLRDTINMSIEGDWDYSSFNSYISNKQKNRDTIFFGKDTLDYEQLYEVVPFVHNHYIKLGKWKNAYVKDTIYIDESDENEEYEESGEYEEDEEYEEYEEDDEETAEYVLEQDSLLTDSILYEVKIDTLDGRAIRIDSSYKSVWSLAENVLIDTLVCDGKGRALAARMSIGKGELYIVTTPLMFTNFGILDKQNASYVFRLLSYMKGKPLARIESYGKHDPTASTPLRYLIITPSLKWALYVISLLILLFMVFTAKRRQRVIPVVETPPNRTLGFIQLISNLFYSRHDNAEILKTKYSVFCSDIKQQTGVDLLDNKQNDSELTRLAEKTGMPEDEIKQLTKEFGVIPYQYDVPDKQLKELMDKMNKIKKYGHKN